MRAIGSTKVVSMICLDLFSKSIFSRQAYFKTRFQTQTPTNTHVYARFVGEKVSKIVHSDHRAIIYYYMRILQQLGK